MFCFTFVRLQIFKPKSRHLFRKVFGINSRNKLVIVPIPVADAARVIEIIELFQREIDRVQCFSFSRKSGYNLDVFFRPEGGGVRLINPLFSRFFNAV